ncbi:MAG: metallophosphoesterase [Desulfurococcales archaeon]|nr:metallophosphoesterase [Desulfurococcales archaeon]
MRLLIISDTHDNLANLSKLISTQDYVSSTIVMHLGDFVSPFTLKALLDTGKEVIGVFGNNDGDKAKMKELLPSLEDQPVVRFFRGVRFVMFHGFKSPEITEEVITSFARGCNGSNVVLYGHTHKYVLRVAGRSMILNPGALSGYLTDRPTYGLIELAESRIVAYIKDLISGEVLERLELPQN